MELVIRLLKIKNEICDYNFPAVKKYFIKTWIFFFINLDRKWTSSRIFKVGYYTFQIYGVLKFTED